MALLPTKQSDQYKLLVVIVCLAAAGLYYNYVWTPKTQTLAALQTHADSLNTMNRRAKNDVARGNIDKLRAQSAEYSKEVEIMRQLVPTGNEVPALLSSVSTAGRQIGLDVSTFSPDGVIQGDQFDTYKFKLGVTGPYNKIAQFLTNVGKLRRIVAPINLSLALAPLPSGYANTMARPLNATFDIQTYVAHTAPGAGSPRGDQ